MSGSRKLLIGGLVIAGVMAYMGYRGAAKSWQYYLTVDECCADRARLVGQPLLVSGRIASGSLAVDDGRTRASFTLAGETSNLQVVCAGPLPGNLAEGVAVLVEGRLDRQGLLCGEKLMTRCASKYQSRVPTSVAEMPGQNGESRR
jgi:cytochrome c-type biogenesis protein CcmE